MSGERSGSASLARRLAKSWPGRALLAAAAWTLVGLVFALPMLAGANRRLVLLESLARWWLWGALAPLIAALDRRLPFTGRQLARRALAYLAGCLLVTSVYLYLFMAARAALGIVPWSALRPGQMFTQGMLGWFLWSSLIYWVIVGGLQAYRYYERYVWSELRRERLERSFSQARLNALRMQLDPHFLFNALNTISSHVERDPRLTRSMIEHLGDLLRLSLETRDRQEVPLAEEMAFLEHYLAIQKIRFGDQLRIEIDVAPEVRSAQVPSLLLQPLVENAIRHGVSRRASGGTVRVSAAAANGRLEIRVTDDGAGLPQGFVLDDVEGLGLPVTRERLAGLYPDGAGSLSLRRRANGGTEVEILLPLRIAEDGGDDDAA